MLRRIIEALARLMAILGGLVLTALIVMTCLSISGRWLNGVLHGPLFDGSSFAAWALGLGIGPINGDFELIEAGMAFCIFAFLPIAQLQGGHASVDILTNRFGLTTNRILSVLWSLLFAFVMVVIAWQLWQGTEAKARYGETTYLIQFPIWWAYGAALAGAGVTALVSVYIAVVRMAEAVTRTDILPSEGGGH